MILVQNNISMIFEAQLIILFLQRGRFLDIRYWCLLQQFPSQPWPSRPDKGLTVSCHVAHTENHNALKLSSAQRAAPHKALTPGVFPHSQAWSCDIFFFCWNWHKKDNGDGCRQYGHLFPLQRWIMHLWNSGRLFIKTKFPPVFILFDHGCS